MHHSVPFNKIVERCCEPASLHSSAVLPLAATDERECKIYSCRAARTGNTHRTASHHHATGASTTYSSVHGNATAAAAISRRLVCRFSLSLFLCLALLCLFIVLFDKHRGDGAATAAAPLSSNNTRSEGERAGYFHSVN